jgi:ATP-dependent DNA helicase RecG
MNMSEAVKMTDRVVTAISLGESHFREFKSALEGPPDSKRRRDKRAIAKDICEALVGFANADGGELLVGVEDDGDVTGFLDADDRLFDYLLSSYKDGVYKGTPLTNVRAIKLKVQQRTILYFSISKSSTTIHHTSEGKCLQRRDLEVIPIAADEIKFTREERLSREYDREYLDGPQADTLDLSLVKSLADQISQGMSPEKCLQYLDLADFNNGYLRLRKAAFLLFAKEPAKWHPRLQIRILKVAGTEVLTGEHYNISEEYVAGNLVSLVENSWTQLRPHLVQTRLTGSAKFETRLVYPELACREALINAIAHRDYLQEGRGIEIYVFNDRIEVKSPGSLLSSLTVQDLKRLEGAHQSRNSLIARVLRELGYMREVGEGMRRIFELMQSNELAEPEIVNVPGSFSVILRNRPVYKAEHILWLEGFSRFDLTREEKTIVVLGYGDRLVSPADIWTALGIEDTEHYRQLVSSLQLKGILVTEVSRNLAQRRARAGHLNVRDIPRFRIQAPNQAAAIGREAKTAIKPSEVGSSRTLVASKHAAKPELEGFDVQARVYIGNLPVDISNRELLDVFSANDLVADVSVPRNAGWSKGFGFAQFDTADAAKSAIRILNGKIIKGRRLVLRPALARAPV